MIGAFPEDDVRGVPGGGGVMALGTEASVEGVGGAPVRTGAVLPHAPSVRAPVLARHAANVTKVRPRGLIPNSTFGWLSRNTDTRSTERLPSSFQVHPSTMTRHAVATLE